MTRHADLGFVRLWWTTAYQDPVEVAFFKKADDRAFTEIAGEVTIQGTVWSSEHNSDLYASWKCPGDARWFALEISRYTRSYTVIREVASRIFRSIHCHDITMSIAPALTIDVPKPSNVPGEFTVKWSPDGELFDGSPGVLLDLVGYADYADHINSLPRLQVPAKKDVVESNDRTVFELVLDNKRVIVTTWRCFALGIDVALLHVGPPNTPRQPILDAMRAAHCPH
ncbi:MAG TPA: hypothetical protein VLB44_18545 [Kofleriaceae bacterium]|nr:hypothetical protein [Kofleriaceae bacterium]